MLKYWLGIVGLFVWGGCSTGFTPQEVKVISVSGVTYCVTEAGRCHGLSCNSLIIKYLFILAWICWLFWPEIHTAFCKHLCDSVL